MSLQPLTESDIPAVIELIDQCEELTMERKSIYWMFWKFFRKTCFLAKEGEKVVGIVLGFLDEVDGDVGFIHELGVLAEYRGQGIATELIDEFGKAVKSMGGRKVALTTLDNNQRAIAFYENRGFSRKEITKVGQARVWYERAV